MMKHLTKVASSLHTWLVALAALAMLTAYLVIATPIALVVVLMRKATGKKFLDLPGDSL